MEKCFLNVSMCRCIKNTFGPTFSKTYSQTKILTANQFLKHARDQHASNLLPATLGQVLTYVILSIQHNPPLPTRSTQTLRL